MISLRGVGYRYPSASGWAVHDVDLDVHPGEIVLLTGPTGCGKSTALRVAAGLLQLHGQGEVAGRVSIGGVDPAVMAPSARVRALGFVSQEPGDQLVAGTIGDEVAFGMESAGLAAAAIDLRVPALLGAVGLDVTEARPTTALSGGQQQRLVVAAALAAGARAMVLDEPLAQLDPDGAIGLLTHLRSLADAGLAVLIVEHRLELCLPYADRVAVMDAGAIVEVAAEPHLATLRRLGLTLPGLADLADRIGSLDAAFALPPRPPPSLGDVVVDARGLSWRYPDAVALDDVDLAIRAGERVAILGANGAGKSTLLAALSGLIPAGHITRGGRIVAVPQDPDLALFCRTVRDELAYAAREAAAPDVADRVAAAATSLSVADLLDRPPQALSRGQRLRVAVAAALTARPAVLLLDEPTSGQDHAQVERLMASLDVPAVVFATHDVDLALRHATRVIVMDAGRIVLDAPPTEAMRHLDLPPLARFCHERGLPPATAAQLAEARR